MRRIEGSRGARDANSPAGGEGRGREGCPYKPAAAGCEVRVRRFQIKSGVTQRQGSLQEPGAAGQGHPAGTTRPTVPLLIYTKSPGRFPSWRGIPWIKVRPLHGEFDLQLSEAGAERGGTCSPPGQGCAAAAEGEHRGGTRLMAPTGGRAGAAHADPSC